MKNSIRSFKDLDVYKNSIGAAMQIYELTKDFPVEEKYSMVDQVRRSSRSVCANIAEAWRKRRYKAAFVAKMNDAESEAAETQVWLDFANRCRYLTDDDQTKLDNKYDHIIAQIVRMIQNSDNWIIKNL